MDASLLLVATVGAYLSGSIPFGLLVARLTGGPDPRSVGSGRTGGTKALRALGRRRAAVVSAGDILKGALPVLAVRALGGGDGTEVAAALFAVVGATRSIWVGFKGGRGIATGFAPIALAAAAPIFIIVIWRTRIVSLGSLAAVAAFAPIEIFVRMQTPDGLSIWALAYSIVGPALVWLAHADNIARLRAGTERTFDAGALTRD